MSVTPRVRRLVLGRDGGQCVLTGEPVANPDTLVPWKQYSLHHRRPRGMGGSRDPVTDSSANLVVLAGSGTTGSHGWVESHREEARVMGLLVPSWFDPRFEPVWVFGRGWVLLGDEPIPVGVDETVLELGLAVAGFGGEGMADHVGRCLERMLRFGNKPPISSYPVIF